MTREKVENQKEENPSLEEIQEKAAGSTNLEKQLEEYKDKYFRLLAEMENARRRMQKEKQEMNRFAVENVITEILLPIDTLEKALHCTDQMSPETRSWATGFQMILSQFKEIVMNHGIVAFSSVGEKFDPHRHEAVEVVETKDHPEGTILQEFVKGYKSGDRTIRAARVKVAKAPSEEEKNKVNNKENIS
ncbi:MAG: nucleotide exchange factor GrpE [Chlamydiae bacterium]|nr:nucleotide exchange factor GrpE [Chlamydiota bacterium]